MDIKKFAVQNTGRLHLRDASDELMYTDDGKEIAVNVYSPGSKQYAKAQAAQSNRVMNTLKRKGKIDQSAEQKTADNAEFLTEITASFENLDYDSLAGEALYKAVYSDTTIGFIADQVAKFVGDWSSFKTPAAKN